jgi:hypothetical protein
MRHNGGRETQFCAFGRMPHTCYGMRAIGRTNPNLGDNGKSAGHADFCDAGNPICRHNQRRK